MSENKGMAKKLAETIMEHQSRTSPEGVVLCSCSRYFTTALQHTDHVAREQVAGMSTVKHAPRALSSNQRKVQGVLHQQADEEGQCQLSLSELASASGMALTSTRQALGRLLELGQVERLHPGLNGAPATYQVRLKNQAEES